jgi:hypothetical protein
MTWSLDAYGATSWGGGTTPPPGPGQQIPPPVDGGTRTFSYTLERGVEAWSVLVWGGGGNIALYPGGGIVVVPDHDNGVCRVLVWWPDAVGLQVMRQTDDGTITLVRGGYPALPGATRRNLSTNPKVDGVLTGYTAGAGSPTLSRISTGTDTWAWRATIAAAGTCEVNIPRSVSTASTLTVALDVRLSAVPSAFGVIATWADAAGVATASTIVVAPASSVVQSVQQWARQRLVLVPPTAAVTLTGLRVTATDMPAGATMDGTRVLIEPTADSDGSYVDGDMLGAQWMGTPELSTSLLADVVEVVDGECPLDRRVTYILTNPAAIGGRMTAEPVVLESRGRTWLTHPASPGAPATVDLRAKPALVRGIRRGRHLAMGRTRPVVVTEARRQAPRGTLVFNAISAAEREWLLATFDDGQPVLLRTPAEYNFDAVDWVSLGDLTEDPEGRKAWQDAWILTAEFDPVDAPSALVS